LQIHNRKEAEGIVFGFVINTKLAEGHHSSQNSEGEGSHLKLPLLQDKDSWVMGVFWKVNPSEKGIERSPSKSVTITLQTG